MNVNVTISVPHFVYDLYEDVAKRLGDCTTAEAMASALQAYAQFLVEEMFRSGELSSKPNLKLHNANDT